jgi:NAD(P)-dependent dehydrogenase (short-subunit alcohol dehydrogenase family)
LSGKPQLNAVIEQTKGYLEPGMLAQWLLPPRTYFFALHKHADLMKRKGFSPYGPSKAALESMSMIWAQDLEGTGITVNRILPGGATETGMIPEGTPEKIRHSLLRPEIIVPAAVYLASNESDGVTGQRIVALEWNRQFE